MLFGQVVIGPPGSGKSTYCGAIQSTLKTLRRNVCVVNLDPANYNVKLKYGCSIDILDLIRLDTAMVENNLGPNGGMIYCLEYLEDNMSWLCDKIDSFAANCEVSKANESKTEDQENSMPYFIFDLPGQVEVYTHSFVLRNIIAKLSETIRLSSVHLVDCFHCLDPFRFISVLMLSLSSMLRLELPHVNVLSKFDLIQTLYSSVYSESSRTNGSQQEEAVDSTFKNLSVRNDVARAYRKVPQSLSFVLDLLPEEIRDLVFDSGEVEAAELDREVQADAAAGGHKFDDLNAAIGQLVDDFNLVGFQTLNLTDQRSLVSLVGIIDKTNGFVQPGLENWS